MKRIILSCLLAASVIVGRSQQFQKKFEAPLADSLFYNHDVEWVDLDNDGFLDILVVAESAFGDKTLVLFKNDTVQGPQWKNTIEIGFRDAAYTLGDFDRDNLIDILFTGEYQTQPATAVLSNSGDFTFVFRPVTNVGGTIIKLADLDQDGRDEMMISGRSAGAPFFNIYKQQNGNWILKHDSLDIQASSMEIFDADGDLDHDIMLAGVGADNKPITYFLSNDSTFYFKPVSSTWQNLVARSQLGDFDLNGKFDVLLSGKNISGDNVTAILFNKSTTLIMKDSLPSLTGNRLMAADMNSDGKIDINFYGTDVNGDTINFIQHHDGSRDLLNAKHLVSQRFGDFDRDGDLDLLQLTQSATGKKLDIRINKTLQANRRPTPPRNPAAAVVFNRLFVYWDKSMDDHTPVGSLTYDLSVMTTQENVMVGDFDMIEAHRLRVSHGNQLTQNFGLFKTGHLSEVDFVIQAIDNAFYASAACRGRKPCGEMEVVKLQACRHEEIQLSSEPDALWMSFAKGYLGKGDSFALASTDTDTVFSFVPGRGDCPKLRTYVIEVVPNLSKTTIETHHACAGSRLSFDVEDGWADIEWRSASRGLISKNRSIIYNVQEHDTVYVKLINTEGCQVLRKIAVNISKPMLTLSGETFQILKGGSVQLEASGGEQYLWAPPAGLNNNTVANPVASPTVTTEYTVNIEDSIGCTAQGKVLVMVEETAFVPNLFTPNDDGKNDALKVYGLTQVKNFSFSIYNREGSLVYSTADVSEAVNVGWNGNARGVQQPGGVYFWKVKGENSTGGKVLLNGKNSGSVVLIR
ncbi:MAG: gliding motility-associated C-terminal domain-containing protein [Bacteroidota bacterium]